MSVIAAPLQKEREGRLLLAKHHGVPMLPDIPQTQEHERSSVVRRDGNGNRELEQTTDVGLGWQLDANLVPETPREGAVKEDVVRRLQGSKAHRAAGFRCRQDPFA
jgi:hypothetical protein